MEAAKGTIVHWLIELVAHRERLKAFREDPVRAIEQSNLTDRQKKVLLSRDPARIRHVVEYELDLDPGEKVMHLIFPIPMHNGPVPP
jgi:hypothetical protein